MFPPLALCSQPAPPKTFPYHSPSSGLTYHRNELDNTSRAHARSSLRIPANMRGVQLCIVWCHTLKAEQECGDQDGSHGQSNPIPTPPPSYRMGPGLCGACQDQALQQGLPA